MSTPPLNSTNPLQTPSQPSALRRFLESPALSNAVLFLLIIAAAQVLTGCEVVWDIFRTGVWAGVILVLLVVFLLLRLFRRR